MSLTLLLSSNSAFLSKQMEDVQQLQGQTKELLIGNFNRLFEMVWWVRSSKCKKKIKEKIKLALGKLSLNIVCNTFSFVGFLGI